jgi:hypothetical protein
VGVSLRCHAIFLAVCDAGAQALGITAGVLLNGKGSSTLHAALGRLSAASATAFSVVVRACLHPPPIFSIPIARDSAPALFVSEALTVRLSPPPRGALLGGDIKPPMAFAMPGCRVTPGGKAASARRRLAARHTPPVTPPTNVTQSGGRTSSLLLRLPL